VTATEFTHHGLAGGNSRSIRRALLLCPHVSDVLPSTRPDAVVVLHHGPGRTEEWTRALAAAGLLKEGEPVPPAA
jgi:hypothetical protein